MIEIWYCFQIQFHLDIGAKSNFVSGKTSKNKFEFEVKVERSKKYLLRVGTVYAILHIVMNKIIVQFYFLNLSQLNPG